MEPNIDFRRGVKEMNANSKAKSATLGGAPPTSAEQRL